MAGGWIADLFGYKDIYDSTGALLPRRKALRVIGASAIDNSALGTTDITTGDGAPGADIPDVSNTYTWSAAQSIRRVQLGVLTANRTITLGSIGPVIGSLWSFPMFSQAHTLAFVNGGINAGTLFTAPSGYIGTPVARWNGSDWELVRI